VSNEELREAVAGTRSTLKSLQRVLRGALGQLTDLEERLDALENAQPEEAQREQHLEQWDGWIRGDQSSGARVHEQHRAVRA
jgi:hypothetical protein